MKYLILILMCIITTPFIVQFRYKQNVHAAWNRIKDALIKTDKACTKESLHEVISPNNKRINVYPKE